MRSGLIVIGVLSLVLAPCAAIPTPQEANDAVLVLRKYGSWAWALGIALIWADLVLPIPQAAVIAALGIIYGTLLAGLLGSLGLITGGLLGYGLVLTSARRFAQRFAGRRSLHKMESLFDRGGAWAIILTRSLPYSVPEAMVFLAGLAGMPMRTFTAALTIGSVPIAFASPPTSSRALASNPLIGRGQPTCKFPRGPGRSAESNEQGQWRSCSRFSSSSKAPFCVSCSRSIGGATVRSRESRCSGRV